MKYVCNVSNFINTHYNVSLSEILKCFFIWYTLECFLYNIIYFFINAYYNVSLLINTF